MKMKCENEGKWLKRKKTVRKERKLESIEEEAVQMKKKRRTYARGKDVKNEEMGKKGRKGKI